MRRALTYRHTIRASELGYITQSVVNNLAPLLFLIFQQQFAIPLSRITLLITFNFCIQLLIDSLSARFVDRIGYRACILAAHIFCATGLIGMAVLPHILPSAYAGLLCAVVCYAIGGGLIEVLISPIVEACPTDNKQSVMSMLHSFYCWGTVGVVALSTLFLRAFSKSSWPVLCCLWALLPIGNAIFFARVPLARLTEEGDGMSLAAAVCQQDLLAVRAADGRLRRLRAGHEPVGVSLCRKRAVRIQDGGRSAGAVHVFAMHGRGAIVLCQAGRQHKSASIYHAQRRFVHRRLSACRPVSRACAVPAGLRIVWPIGGHSMARCIQPGLGTLS